MNREESIETEWKNNLNDATDKIDVNTKWEDIPAIQTLKKIAEKWECGKTEKYIFPGDEEAIAKYNESINGNEDYELQLHLPPHPFAGNPYAPIWVINLNPGYNEEADEADFKDPEGDGWKWSIAQLKGEIFCNYYLRMIDRGKKKKGACNWWKKYLLSQNICDDDIELADKFFSLDYFPYQSKKYKDPGEEFASIKLFEKIIKWGKERGVLFLIMRKGVRDQLEAKYLNGYDKLMYAVSQASWISLGNLYGNIDYDIKKETKEQKKTRMQQNEDYIKNFLNDFSQQHKYTTKCCICEKEKCTCEWQLTTRQ